MAEEEEEEVKIDDFFTRVSKEGFSVNDVTPFLPSVDYKFTDEGNLDGYKVKFNQGYYFNRTSENQVQTRDDQKISNMGDVELPIEHDVEYYVEVIVNAENFLVTSATFTGISGDEGGDITTQFPHILFDGDDATEFTGYYPILKLKNGALEEYTQRSNLQLSDRQFRQLGGSAAGVSARPLVEDGHTSESNPVRVRNIVAGTGITIDETASSIIINATGTGEGGGTGSCINIGSAVEVYNEGPPKSSDPFEFRTLKGEGNTDVLLDPDNNDRILVSGGLAENRAGASHEVYVEDFSKPFVFKGLEEGTGVYLESTDDNIIINVTGQSGSCANTGDGAEIYIEDTANPFIFRTLTGAENIEVSIQGNTVEIKSEDQNCASEGSADWFAYVDGTKNPAKFRGLSFGDGIDASSDGCVTTLSVDTGCCDLDDTLSVGSSSPRTLGVGGATFGSNYYALTPAANNLHVEGKMGVGVSPSEITSYSDKVVICGSMRVKGGAGSIPTEGDFYLGTALTPALKKRISFGRGILEIGTDIQELDFKYPQAISINPQGATSISHQSDLGGYDINYQSPATGSAILGGSGNAISGNYNVIIAGINNQISGGNTNVIGGGSGINVDSSEFSVSVGGRNNDVSGSNFAVIGGGFNNLISGSERASIAGGSANKITDAFAASIGGGQGNLVADKASVIAGGESNTIKRKPIGGGYNFIGAGVSHTISGSQSTIAGGNNNIISGSRSITLGGTQQIIGANDAVTAGNYSIVQPSHHGAFVFSDSITANTFSSGANTMVLSFKSGVFVETDSGLYVNGNPVLTGETPEGDTLQSVTSRGNTTTTDIKAAHISGSNLTLGNGVTDASIQLDGDFGGGDLTLQNLGSNQDILFKVNDGGVTTTPFTIQGSTSNVGIHTNSPSTKFHLGSGIARFQNAGSNYIEVDGSVAGANIARISSRFNRFEIVTNAGAGDPDISLMPAAGGNVGIGNNAPAEALSISTAAEAKDNNIDFLVSNSYNAGLLFRDPAGGRGSIISNTDNDLIFSTNGTGISAETMRIDSDGNVGVGTATPNSKFHVEGVVSGSNSFLGTGDGNRITNNGVPYLLSGDSPAETQNLDQVLAQGNTSTRDMSVADISGSGLFLSGAGSVGPEISLQGAYTTWEIENQYVGGANNDMFRIRNTALADDALVINRGNNKVGIGTTNPTNDLHVVGTMQLDNSVSDAFKIRINGGVGLALDHNSIRSTNAGTDVTFAAGKDLIFQTYDGGFKEAMRIDTSGRVGIGTDDPSATFSIGSGDKRASNTDFVISDDTPQIELRDTGNSALISFNDTQGVRIFSNYSTSTSPQFTIENDGNVGIGTATPDDALTIVGTSADFSVRKADNGLAARIAQFSAGGAQLRLYDSGSNETIRLAGDGSNSFITGNVGIGTVSPSSALEVRGGNIDIGTNDIEGAANCKIEMDAADGFTLTNPNNAHGIDIVADDLTFFGGGIGNRKITTNAGDLSIDPVADLLLNENGGNVGVGTDSPQADLHVSGSGIFGIIGANSVNSNVTVAGYDDFGLDFRAHGTWTHWKARVGHGKNFELYNDGTVNQKQVLELGDTTKDNASVYIRSTGAFIEAGMNASTSIPVVSVGCLADSDHLGGAYLDVRDAVTSTHRYEFNRDGTFVASGVNVSGDVGGTGDGGRITLNGTGYLLVGEAAEADTLQSVTDRGNVTTGSVRVEGQLQVGPNDSSSNGELLIRGKEANIILRGLEGSDKAHTIREDAGTLSFSANTTLSGTNGVNRFNIQTGKSFFTERFGVEGNGVEPKFYLASTAGGAQNKATYLYNPTNSADFRIALDGTHANSTGDIGTDAFTIKSSTNNVGIGTTNPNEKLELGAGGKIGLKDAAGTYDSVIFNDGTTFKVADGAGSYHVDKINLLGLLDLGVGHTIKGIDNSIIANKDILAPHTGSFGFRTYGSTNQYDAISSQFIDNNNNALSFNVKAGGTTSEAVRIDKDGNVGIGTTSPDFTLEVVADDSAGVMAVRNGANARDTFRSENAAGTRTFNIGNDANGHGLVLVRGAGGTTTSQIAGNGDTYFDTDTLYIDHSANTVGIGTTAPAAKLEILGKQMITVGANASPQTEDYLYIGGDGLAGADAAIYIGNRGNGSGYGWRMFYEGTGSGNDNKLKFKSENLGSPVDVITMLQDGKVGIGATEPSVGLQLGNSTSGQTKTAIFNSEGGAEVGLTIKSRTNRAKLAVSDNDTTAYVVAEGTIASFGRADTAATTNISVLSNGYVGIGTTNPSYKLSVSGGDFGVTNGNKVYIGGAIGDSVIGYLGNTSGKFTLNSDGNRDVIIGSGTVTNAIFIKGTDGNVGIGTTSPSNALDVVGHFSATSKSFLINHPTKENKKLQYASLEGPENGIYVRGTTDKETIELPEYWSELVHEDSITVVLTPIGKKQDLFIKEKSNKLIKIGGVEGSFDYVVYGERKDIDKLEIEPLKV